MSNDEINKKILKNKEIAFKRIRTLFEKKKWEDKQKYWIEWQKWKTIQINKWIKKKTKNINF